MDKYYTPELEEFYLGFQFEIDEYKDGDSEWKRDKGYWREMIYDLEYPHKEYIQQMISFGDGIRVKYLSKEDIESLGFNITKDNEEIELSLESKKYIGGPSAGDDYKIVILYGLDNKEMWIYKQCNNGYEYDLFKGVIKNKSELIKLLKQLQIE